MSGLAFYHSVDFSMEKGEDNIYNIVLDSSSMAISDEVNFGAQIDLLFGNYETTVRFNVSLFGNVFKYPVSFLIAGRPFSYYIIF